MGRLRRAVLVMGLALGAVLGAQEKQPERIPGRAGKLAGFAVLDRTALRPGDRFRVALDLEIEPGWHIYGNPVGPGVGQPTTVTAEAPEGFRFGPVRYPEAQVLDQSELGPGKWVWVYEDTVRLYLEGEVARTVRPGTYTLRFQVRALACTESCVPEEVVLPLTVRVVDPGTPVRKQYGDLFAGFAAARPAGGPAPGGAPAAGTGGEKKPAVRPAAGLEERLARFEPRALEEEPIGSVFWALVFGFLAGLFLNVMPCVLPVISIKVLSLVQQAQEDRRRLLQHGLVFAGGILVIFVVLAAAAAFAGASWGAHFQKPVFVVGMIGVIFLFALGLFDVYTIAVPGFVQPGQAREGLWGSFLKGMLATALATPCAGPFLGATVAYAMRQPPPVIFAVFLSMGLGMAFPYVLLTAFPPLLRFVPRPGAWMTRFKELMGFLLLGTVVYLLTILRGGLQMWAVTLCLVLGFGAWLFGRVTGPERSRVHRWTWRTVAVGLTVLLAVGSYNLFVVPPPHHEPFSLDRLEALLAEGRTVVVDFTADWCPNCKFVEKTVLESEAVRRAMQEKGVVFMVADITQPHPTAEALLARLGSRSIPFLAVFPGNEPNRPYVLRDIYTRGDVLRLLARCPEPPAAGAAVANGQD